MVAFWILLGVFLGIAGKYLVELKLAGHRRRDQQLKWSVELLAAAGRVAQTVATWCNWQQELRHRGPDERTVEDLPRLAARSVEKRARVHRARADAYRGRSAVRLPREECEVPTFLTLSPGDLGDETDAGRSAKKQIGA